MFCKCEITCGYLIYKFNGPSTYCNKHSAEVKIVIGKRCQGLVEVSKVENCAHFSLVLFVDVLCTN